MARFTPNEQLGLDKLIKLSTKNEFWYDLKK